MGGKAKATTRTTKKQTQKETQKETAKRKMQETKISSMGGGNTKNNVIST